MTSAAAQLCDHPLCIYKTVDMMCEHINYKMSDMTGEIILHKMLAYTSNLGKLFLRHTVIKLSNMHILIF